MGGQPGPQLARLEVVGWHRLWLHEWVRSEVGSEGGTLEKFGFQELAAWEQIFLVTLAHMGEYSEILKRHGNGK